MKTRAPEKLGWSSEGKKFLGLVPSGYGITRRVLDRQKTPAQAGEDGSFMNAGSKTVTVLQPPPPPPVLTLSGNAQANEGSAYTLNLAAANLGSSTITSWSINWGDGPPQTVQGNPTSQTHSYVDGPNQFTISAEATIDSVNHPANNTVSVTINNVPPTISLAGANQVDQGVIYTLTLGSVLDPWRRYCDGQNCSLG